MNYLEFAQKVKAKYPDYSDMDDRELAEKMVAKYPDDYSDVTFDATVPLRGAEPEGMKYTPSWEGKVTGQPEPKKDWSKGIFPTAGDIPKEGWGKVIRPLMGTAEGLDVLKRGLAHITGQGDIKDPEANIWAKPRQALRDYLEKKKGEVGEEKTTYTIGLPPQYGGVQTRTITKKEDLEFQKQMGDALFDIVGDPLIVKNMITGIFKQIGKISPKKIVGAGARGLTKIPEETLTKYSTKKGRLEMAKSYGKEAATGDAMVRQVYKQKLPEEALVNTFIEQADDIPLKPIIDKLEEAKKGIKFKKTNQDAINAIDNLIEDYTQYGKKVTAAEFRELRQELDFVLGDVYEREGLSLAKKAFKDIRRQMKEALVNASPKEYKEVMAEYARKMNARSELKEILGKDYGWKAKKKAEALIKGVEKQGRTQEKKILEAYDELYGTNFSKRAKSMAEARQIAAEPGPPGGEFEASLFPKIATGWGKLGVAMIGIGWPRYSGKIIRTVQGMEDAVRAGFKFTGKTLEKIPTLADDAAKVRIIMDTVRPKSEKEVDKINELVKKWNNTKDKKMKNLIERDINRRLK